MKKVCFVIQRYGLEVNGGAELQGRLFVEHLKEVLDIEVVTTKAVDYISWANEYNNDIDVVNGVTVRRFANSRERDMDSFAKLCVDFVRQIAGNPEKEENWLIEQGPVCPDLVDYIHAHKDDYDVFIFSTYLYYTTIHGLKGVERKSILIPEAHDEAAIHMSLLKDVFQNVGGLLYNTEIERDMVESLYNVFDTPYAVAGIGIDEKMAGDAKAGKEKVRLETAKPKTSELELTELEKAGLEMTVPEPAGLENHNYIVYIGRIDEGKRCHVLFDYFEEYKSRHESGLKLVLMGKEAIEIPNTDDIISLGFVSDEDKCNVLAGALALVLPSEFESLSMVVLEAMKLGVPVLINGACDVVRGHCLKSNAGLFYYDYYEFDAALTWLIEHPRERKLMGKNGMRYVKENYDWNVVVGKILKLVDEVYQASQDE